MADYDDYDEELSEEEPESEGAKDDWVRAADLKDAFMILLKRKLTWPVIERTDNYFTKLRKLREYYQIELPFMLEHHEARPNSFYRAYPYDWGLLQTPIEQEAWQAIRSLGHIVLYPQFPVERFHLDFAAPHLNIGLELDGKAWHNEAKDLQRDKELKRLGWKIYRITGSEMNKVIPDPFGQEFSTNHEALEAIEDFINNSGEGVIYAIRTIHFDDSRGRFIFRPQVSSGTQADHEYWVSTIRQICYNCLQDHTNYHRV